MPSDVRDRKQQRAVKLRRRCAKLQRSTDGQHQYLLQVPANRIGYTALSLGQLKVMQEVITIAVFVPFAIVYMKQPLKLDFLWAALCLVGAAYFAFRGN